MFNLFQVVLGCASCFNQFVLLAVLGWFSFFKVDLVCCSSFQFFQVVLFCKKVGLECFVTLK